MKQPQPLQSPPDYRRLVAEIHRDLGIPADYEARRGLPLQPECQDLLPLPPDVFQREQFLEREARDAWLEMQAAAGKEGVELQVVSAFRSAVYQQGIFRRKLDSGQSIEEILRVNAAPGYSEHHSGKALDLGTPDYPLLEESFEHSPAYRWLDSRAGDFGFTLSFPRDNAFGLLYEPWHWRFRG